MLRRHRWVIAVALLLFVFHQSATAAVLYTLDPYLGQPPAYVPRTSSNPGLSWNESAGWSSGSQNISGDWSLYADQGLLRSRVNSTVNGVWGAPNYFRGRSQFFYDDLLITGFSGPGGVSPGIAAALNLRLKGKVSYEPDSKVGDFNAAFGSVIVNVEFQAHPLSGSNPLKSGNATGAGATSGFLASVPIGPDGTIDTNVRIPFRATASPTFANKLRITLEAGAWGGDGAFGDGTAPSFSDFTLHFATDRPVFDLPVGATINSGQGGIVENQYTLPGASNDVPEPASLAIWGLGGISVVAVACARRRRKQRRSRSRDEHDARGNED